MILPKPPPQYDAVNEAQTRAALITADRRNVKHTDYATTAKRGIIRVDGTTTTVDPDGTLHAAGSPTRIVTASEDIAAGALVNLFSAGGSLRMRNASATDATKPASGFVLLAVSSGAAGTFYGPGLYNSALSGLTPGATYYLDVTAGAVNAAQPSAGGNVIQIVGVAITADELLFNPEIATRQL